ncbi:MAG: S9 family peptidase [Myxococcales bacterium]|nr:S9 family peptidase [Myxococcales bacterium]
MSQPLDLDDVIRLPAPGNNGPVAYGFAPDDRTVTFLHGERNALVRTLWAWDPDSGERTEITGAPGGGIREGALSLEEQLRRERKRERGLGISRYTWSKGGDTLMIPVGGDVWVQRGTEGPLTAVAQGVQVPALSPDGQRVAYVRDGELHVSDVQGGAAQQLTHGAAESGRTHGLAEYIAQEEMSRYTGFWWSHDGASIAYVEVDEGHIPVWRIPHQAKPEPSWEDHRYPFPGADNAKVSLWVVPADGSAPPTAIPLRTDAPWEYLARVAWLADGQLLAAVQDRRQKRLDLIKVDPATGEQRVVLTETSEHWINLHHLLKPLRGEPGAFLWGTESTGFQHLVRVDAAGNVQRLTDGPWVVDAVVGLDEAQGFVYFTANEPSPLERHLYRVPLAGGPMERLTPEPGWHDITMNRAADRFLDHYSSPQSPPSTVLRDISGAALATFPQPPDPRVTALGLTPPELIEVPLADGTVLHGALFRPEGEGPWPLVVRVYGGPHAQRVQRNWGLTTDMNAQYLRNEGYAVLKLDNRGSARRGLAFESALKGDMGNVELQDQVAGVQQLVAQGVADPQRVAIQGWSYGGYLSAMALARFPDTFHVAIAGAPVTFWGGYDTHYTERYMGLPSENAHGYEVSSVMHHIESMRGDLMLVHGMLDENVHFRHTAQLIDALFAAGKEVTLQVYPGERHAPRDPAGRRTMLERELAFLERHL